MLTQLSISNFAIVKSLDIDLLSGMTTITGETGAGKSIAIDALSVCLGGRCESSMVRPGSARADICCSFNINNNKAALAFLKAAELDNELECILRRTISKEGRSKAYVNGRPVPVSQLKELGGCLLQIHGQHAHQGLLNSSFQRNMLDQYANHQQLLWRVNLAYQKHIEIKDSLNILRHEQAQLTAKVQLLEYQVEELDSFDLAAGEFEQIEAEHKKLSNSELLKQQCQQLSLQLSEDQAYCLESGINDAIATLDSIVTNDSSLLPLQEMLNSALISIQETSNEINHYEQSIDQDPQRLADLEDRLSKSMQLARKHQVAPGQLPEVHQAIQQELQALNANDLLIEQLEKELAETESNYITQSDKLSASRTKSANKLEKLITKSIQSLAMEHADFKIELTSAQSIKISPTGYDTITFKVTTNPGQPMDLLSKIVSGGELSRISLAISVITANKIATPTLIFDEVDVGISGPTAATVGSMLRKLGQSTQILCVTHLPQVAGCGNQQMQVEKQSDGATTHTTMVALNEQSRLQELARLIGGNIISDITLASAKELLVS